MDLTTIDSELQKLEAEAAAVRERAQQLDNEKNQLLTRLLELQGAAKYLASRKEALSSK